MAPLAADRMFKVRSLGRTFAAKVAANAIPYQGGLVSANATGYAKASGTTAGERVLGWSTAKVDATGLADGAALVQVQTGAILLDNDGTNPLTQAHLGKICYVKDDHTVQTSAGGSSVIAGRFEGFASNGQVWVYIEDDIGTVDAQDVATVADSNTIGGLPILHVYNIPDAAADYDIVVREKVEVYDVVVIKNAAGAGNTIQLKHGATAVSDAIAAAVDKTVTRAGTLDPAQTVYAAGDTMRITATKAAGSMAAKVFVLGVKRA